MSVGQGISVQVTRGGQTTVNLKPTFTFNGNPQRYNYSELGLNPSLVMLTVDFLIKSS